MTAAARTTVSPAVRPRLRWTAHRRARHAVLAVGVVLALSACGAAAGPTDGAGTAPVDDYLLRGFGGGGDLTQAAADTRAVEEGIAECMAAQGFEYTPVVPGAAGPQAVPELDARWGTRAFAEQYGYGITTLTEGPAAAGAQAPGDPNTAQVEAMSEVERLEYARALDGDGSAPDEDRTESDDWRTQGCRGQAYHEVFEKGRDTDRFAEFEREINAVWEAAANDPRMARATLNWAHCMADAGFPDLVALADAPAGITAEADELWHGATGREAASDGEAPPLSPADLRARWRELRESEVDLALADFDCKEAVEYTEIELRVTSELQQEFLDTHEQELQEWLEAQAGRDR